MNLVSHTACQILLIGGGNKLQIVEELADPPRGEFGDTIRDAVLAHPGWHSIQSVHQIQGAFLDLVLIGSKMSKDLRLAVEAHIADVHSLVEALDDGIHHIIPKGIIDRLEKIQQGAGQHHHTVVLDTPGINHGWVNVVHVQNHMEDIVILRLEFSVGEFATMHPVTNGHEMQEPVMQLVGTLHGGILNHLVHLFENLGQQDTANRGAHTGVIHQVVERLYLVKLLHRDNIEELIDPEGDVECTSGLNTVDVMDKLPFLIVPLTDETTVLGLLGDNTELNLAGLRINGQDFVLGLAKNIGIALIGGCPVENNRLGDLAEGLHSIEQAVAGMTTQQCEWSLSLINEHLVALLTVMLANVRMLTAHEKLLGMDQHGHDATVQNTHVPCQRLVVAKHIGGEQIRQHETVNVKDVGILLGIGIVPLGTVVIRRNFICRETLAIRGDVKNPLMIEDVQHGALLSDLVLILGFVLKGLHCLLVVCEQTLGEPLRTRTDNFVVFQRKDKTTETRLDGLLGFQKIEIIAGDFLDMDKLCGGDNHIVVLEDGLHGGGE